MWHLDEPMLYLVALAVLAMAAALLKGITQCSLVCAQQLIDQRRDEELRMREANAAAEAAGRAAALEPLNTNPDGTIEEPIIGIVEKR